ncbi:cytochrome c [Hyphomicrobium sp. CS1GBMeth3]|uniref:c-type cytochrome n=1 Tax=Hyphomicrobium sp. CS1GBMeth3 TaxID=1892845 RepID=UPI000AF62C23|nr:cytochrome c [Hyphomicrobium sp. CS1GBMeth3]
MAFFFSKSGDLLLMNHHSLPFALVCMMASMLMEHPAFADDAGTPPFDLSDPAKIEIGKKRFGANCAAYCHGSEGEGGKTPSFKGNTNFAPANAHKTITEGRVGADVMPPWGRTFTSEQIWELVAYLNYLSEQPASR